MRADIAALAGTFLLLCGSPAPSARADEYELVEGPAVAGLRCEYRAGPLGIDSSAPRLSWVLGSAKRGVVQHAASRRAGARHRQER